MSTQHFIRLHENAFGATSNLIPILRVPCIVQTPTEKKKPTFALEYIQRDAQNLLLHAREEDQKDAPLSD